MRPRSNFAPSSLKVQSQTNTTQCQKKTRTRAQHGKAKLHEEHQGTTVNQKEGIQSGRQRVHGGLEVLLCW